MKLVRSLSPALWIALSAVVFAPLSTRAQSCQTSSDLDDATRIAIASAGQRFFAMATKGDAASMRQNAIPSLASDFSGIEATVKDHERDLAAAQATVKGAFLLDGSTPSPHAEFYCGVFGKSGQTGSNKTLADAAVNLFWSPVAFIDFGGEYFYAHRVTTQNFKGDAYALEALMRVRF